MSGLQGKRWYFFEWDEYNLEHLWDHGITPEEAQEIFYNPYIITPNKKCHGPRRYRIDGSTNSGRHVRLIFKDLGKNIARIITGWDL